MDSHAKSRFDWSRLLGYDVFISYKRGPLTSIYARNLRNGLAALGFSCFLDQEETEGGVELTPALQRALRRSRLLVVLAEPDVASSRYVPDEIRTFAGKRKGRIVPINVRSFLAPGKPQPEPFDYLQTLTWLNEAEREFELGSPTETVLGGIRRAFGRVRVASISRAIMWATIIVLAAIAVVALWQRQTAVREAEMALGQAYAADLNLAELAHRDRDAPLVVERTAQYESLLGRRRMPEFAWRYLWGLYHGQRHQLRHEPETPQLAFSPDGKLVATSARYDVSSGGGVIRLWDTSSGAQRHRTDLAKFETGGFVAFAPDGVSFATNLDETNRPSRIAIWDGHSGALLRSFPADCGFLGLTFTRDGRSILAPCRAEVGAPFQIWDAQTGAARFRASEPDEDAENADVVAWAYSPDGRTLAILQRTKRFGPSRVRVWDATDRSLRYEIWPEIEAECCQESIGGLAYSPDTRILATAHESTLGSDDVQPGRIRLWDAHSGKPLGLLEGHKSGARLVAFLPGGKRLASVSGEVIFRDATDVPLGSEFILWDLDTRKPLLAVEQAQTGFIERLVTAEHAPLVALVSTDAVVTLIDAATAQVRTQFRGHTQPIGVVGFSNDGRLLATASSDGIARIWDTQVGPSARSFAQPGESVTGSAVSPDGATVALGFSDGTAVLADATRLHATRRVLKVPSGPLGLLAFSADGRHLAGYASGTVSIADLTANTRRELKIPEVEDLRLDATGRYLTVVSRGGWVERWDIERSRRAAESEIDDFSMRLVALSDDGSLVAVRGTDADSHLEIRHVAQWRRGATTPMTDRAVEITAAAFSADGSRLAIAQGGRFARTGGIRILDVSNLRTLLELPAREPNVHALTFDASGAQLASAAFASGTWSTEPRVSFSYASTRVRIWDLASGTERLSVSVDSHEINSQTRERQSSLSFVRGGQALAIRELNEVRLVDMGTGRLSAASRPSPAAIRSIGVATDNRAFVITARPQNAGMTDEVRIWDLARAAPRRDFAAADAPEAWSMTFSSDGGALAVGSEAGTVRVYDARTGAVTAVLEGHRRPVRSLSFAGQPAALVAASADGMVRSWNLRTGKASELARLGATRGMAISPGADTVVAVDRDGTLTATALRDGARRFASRIDAAASIVLATQPAGTRFVVATQPEEGVLSIRDQNSGAEIARLQGDPGIRAVAVSRNGLVAAASVRGSVTLWRLPGTQILETLPARADFGTAILDVAFDADATQLAAARADGTVVLWRREGNSWLARELTGHTREVQALAFAPDGATLASADVQGRVVLWDVGPSGSGELRSVLRADRSLRAVRLAPDGETLATGGGDKSIVLWNVASGRREAMLLGHTQPVSAIVFGRNGRMLASASAAEVITWDVRNRRRVGTFAGSAPIHLAPDGNRLLTTVDDRTVAVWRTGSGYREATLGGLRTRPRTLMLSADSSSAVVLADDLATLWDAADGEERASLGGFRGSGVAAMTLSPDSNTLATARQDGSIDLWHVLTGRRLLTVHGLESAASDLSFSADGNRLIAATASDVRLWRAPSTREAQTRVKQR